MSLQRAKSGERSVNYVVRVGHEDDDLGVFGMIVCAILLLRTTGGKSSVNTAKER